MWGARQLPKPFKEKNGFVLPNSGVKGYGVWVGEEAVSNGKESLQAIPEPEVGSGVHWTPISRHPGQPQCERDTLNREPAERAA